ncbi:MAG: hypothetical protein MJ245_04575 [Clostridia bacterium]|nr:hypothetical protein [Clostridia bacterium]
MKKLYLLVAILSMTLLVGCGNEKVSDDRENIIRLDNNCTAYFDVDGDGEDDEIGFTVEEDDLVGHYTLTCNDATYKEDVAGPYTFCYLVRLDESKNEYVFDLQESGMSDDYASHFIGYNNGKLVDLGSCGGIYNSDFKPQESIEFNFDGTFKTSERAQIVQTWFYDTTYSYDKDMIIKNEEDFYHVDYDTELLTDFEFYKEPNMNAEKTLVRSETIMKFTGIDNDIWTRVEYLDLYGEKAVAYFPVYYFCYMDENMETMTSDVFKDLIFAD